MTVSKKSLWALSLLITATACPPTGPKPPGRKGEPRPVTPEIVPKVADKALKVERVAVMPTEVPAIFDAMDPDGPGQQRAFWTMVISDGSQGFPKGILATTGPFPGTRSDRLYHIDPQGKVSVLMDGLAGSQQLIWATGKYREAGELLVSEPISGQIRAISEGGRKITVVADLAPVVPSGLTIGPDIMGGTGEDVLYVTDMGQTPEAGAVWRVPPPGSGDKPQKVSDVPLPKLPDAATPATAGRLLRARAGDYGGLTVAKAVACACRGTESMLAGLGDQPSLMTFTWSISSMGLTDEPLMNVDGVVAISKDAGAVGMKSRLAHGRMNAIMFPSFGPGSSTFGSGLYVPMLGSPSKQRNGGVTVVEGEKRTNFVTNLHATSVVFDEQGVMGEPGAMYVAAFDPYVPGEIWRVGKR